MRMRRQQLARQWAGRRQVTVEYKNAQVESLGFQVVRVAQSRVPCCPIRVLVTDLVDINGRQFTAQRQRVGVGMQRFGEKLIGIVQPFCSTVSLRQVERQILVVGDGAQKLNHRIVISVGEQRFADGIEGFRGVRIDLQGGFPLGSSFVTAMKLIVSRGQQEVRLYDLGEEEDGSLERLQRFFDTIRGIKSEADQIIELS